MRARVQFLWTSLLLLGRRKLLWKTGDAGQGSHCLHSGKVTGRRRQPGGRCRGGGSRALPGKDTQALPPGCCPGAFSCTARPASPSLRGEGPPRSNSGSGSNRSAVAALLICAKREAWNFHIPHVLMHGLEFRHWPGLEMFGRKAALCRFLFYYLLYYYY